MPSPQLVAMIALVQSPLAVQSQERVASSDVAVRNAGDVRTVQRAQ